MRTTPLPKEKSFVYCASGEAGIHLLSLSRKSSFSGAEAHPSKSFFLAAHPGLPVLYSIDEAAGTISAFAIASDGLLSKITEIHIRGTVPCHLAVDPGGRFVIVAAYCGGIEIFPIRPDGGMERSSDIHQPTGSGLDPQRQTEPHPHGIALVDDLAYVADLGTDRIFVLKINGSSPHFTPLPELTQTLAPGAGPRHFTVHPGGTHAIAINELDNTVTSYIRDPASSHLTNRGSVSTLPSDFKGDNWTAEVGYHPAADVCYASNRGHDSLAVFSVDRRSGGLQLKQFIAAGGEKPQHFLFDPSGSMLLIANAGSNCVASYRMDRTTGFPVEKLPDFVIKKPMCLVVTPPYPIVDVESLK